MSVRKNYFCTVVFPNSSFISTVLSLMNIIITGASKGIGFDTVKAFASEPGNKIIALSRNVDLLNRLRSECEQMTKNSEVLTYPCDLESETDLNNLSSRVRPSFNEIDVLINNAGLMINKSFQEMTGTDFDRIFNNNVKSVFKIIQILLPQFRSGSHIVNIGSMGGFQGSVKFKGLSLYSASKGALAVLSECLAEELREKGIKVNCLALGSVQTEMFNEAFQGGKAQVTSGQMAEFIKNFAINGHSFFNGKVIPVSITSP
jgi:short-subunit dehydrogenase